MQDIKSALSEQKNRVFDYLVPIANGPEPLLGSPVVSGHLKVRNGSVFTRFFVTGICRVDFLREPSTRIFPLQPVMTGKTVIGTVNKHNPPAKTPNVLTEDLVRAALEPLERLAHASQENGGLGLSPYTFFDEITVEHRGAEPAINKRALAQQLRFEIACAHLVKHMEVDEEVWAHRQTASQKMGLSEIEHYVGEIYSLARLFGVKEILPKIEALIPGPLSHWLGEDASNVNTKLASLIVKLRRRGLMGSAPS